VVKNKTPGVEQMTRRDFDAVPFRTDTSPLTGNSIVILPLRTKHDSGFRCMDFVLIKGNKAICRLSGCSDLLHIDGIGGMGHDWLEKYGDCPRAVPPTGWSIDCLPVSGLLRMWPSRDRWNGVLVDADACYSSFEIYANPKEKT
jgi:hypothetical protein